MRVYKFLSCKYGLKALREQRLKISEVHSLNDAFDLLPFDLSDPEFRQGVVASRSEIGSNRGMLCFSQHWHNPVLWAHYAESHKGLCIGFDVPDDCAQPVTYIERPIKVTRLDYETANKMLFTKYEHWHYEEGVRMWSTLEDKSGGYYFKKFGDDLRVAEVICGAASPVSRRRIDQALGRRSNGIKTMRVRLAFDAFRVVVDEG
jgi:hypothetical protein